MLYSRIKLTLLVLVVFATNCLGIAPMAQSKTKEEKIEKAEKAAEKAADKATEKAASKDATPAECTDRAWTEKQKIGSDVPMETWRDSKMAPWAALLCIHGLGLHNTSYAAFGKQMAILGVATYAMDVRGFGSWQNTNESKTVDFPSALNDIKSALIAIHKAHPTLPVILLGESMGGALAIQATALNQSLVDGLVASVPSGVRYGQKLTDVKVALALLRGPKREMKIGKNIVNKATNDPSLRQEWKEDPNARMTMSPKELVQFQSFMDKNVVRAKQITNTPVLFVQGGSDRLVKVKGSADLFKAIQTNDKDFVILGNSEHLIFEEGQFDNHVIDVVSSWMDKHVARPFLSKRKTEDGTEVEFAHKHAAGRLLLAQGYMKLEDYKSALEQLQYVLVLGRGTNLAQDAQELMMELPIELIAPKTGPETRVTTEEIKFTSHETAMKNDKPSVLIFCASWVKPCKSLDAPLQELYDHYGENVNFVHIDADDPCSQGLVKKYGIGPLPAILYLNGVNEVTAYTLGVPDQSGMKKEILKLMTSETAKAN